MLTLSPMAMEEPTATPSVQTMSDSSPFSILTRASGAV
jgi:hypothetical protein